jgi:hypothetical protein
VNFTGAAVAALRAVATWCCATSRSTAAHAVDALIDSMMTQLKGDWVPQEGQ